VDISVPDLVRTVRRFVDEEERVGGKASTGPRRQVSDSSLTKERHPEFTPAATKPKAPVTYQVAEQPSSRVQEEEFAKAIAPCALPGRLRLAVIADARAGSPAKSA
jgi:hypothetical protein